MQENNKYTVIGTRIGEKPGRSIIQDNNKITQLENVYYLVLSNGGNYYELEVNADYFNKNGNWGTVIILQQKQKKDLIKL